MNNKSAKIIIIILIIVAVIAAFFLVHISVKDDFLKMQYPLKYEDLISKYSSEYELDPYLVSAIVYTESRFNEKAESQAGAKGLMQIIDDTAEWISGKLDLSEYNIYDPETNIKFGCWYLNYLNSRFDSNVDLVLAAYNAGPNRVDQWLESNEYSHDGENLHSIPYEETSDYVKKVLEIYDQYKELYTF